MKGFILVEFLVSILILSFIMAGIYGILYVGGNTYNTSLGLVELQQQARGGAERLESIFLQLTGGEEMSRVVEYLKS